MMGKPVIVVGVVLLVVLASTAGVAAGSLTQGDVSDEGTGLSAVDQQGTFSVSSSSGADDISIWDRSVLPLRADLDEAATVVNNQETYLSTPSEMGSANRDSVGVFDASADEIPLEYRSVPGANTGSYAGDDVEVIVGKITPDADLDDIDLVTSFDDEALANLNDNVSFEKVASPQLDGSGEFDENIAYDEPESGQYVALVATEGMTVDNDDLVAESPTEVIGLDGFFVQDSPSVVDHDSEIEPGDTVTFDAETELTGDVDHVVALYDESTFIDQQLDIIASEEPSTDLTKDDITIETEIGEVDGVATLEDDVSLLGTSISEQQVANPTSVTDLVTFLADEGDRDEPNVQAGDTVLNASVTALADREGDAEIDVETLEDWNEDEYRWIHVASGDDADQFATSTGTLSIEEDDDDGPSPPSPPPSPDPDPDPEADINVTKAGLSDSKITIGESVEVTATLENVGDADGTYTAELLVDGEVVDEEDVSVDAESEETVTFTHTFDTAGEFDVAVNDATAGTVTVSEAPSPAEFSVSHAELSETEIDVGDSVDVNADISNTGEESGTFTAELVVDGDVVDDQDVTVDGEATEAVSFTHTFNDAGEFDVAISDAAAGTVMVSDTVDDTDDDVDDDDDTIPGFGALAALAALASALLALRVRNHEV